MPELLLELGCEELPASFVRKAYTDLQNSLTDKLLEAGIAFGGARSIGTPRRLIVQIRDIEERQPDVTKDQRGPAVRAAYDAEGKPTKALEGFCRSQGVTLEELRKDGDYVWITKTVEGRPTRELLSEMIPEAIRALSFDKAMRWGSHRIRFARPIRWILASFGGEPVPFDLEGIESGLFSRGHRFYSPEGFKATTFDELITELRNRKVEPDPSERERTVRDQASAVANGRAEVTDDLVDENVFLTEWPTAIEGTFREEFLELPRPVLVTAMAKHEKFFPVLESTGKLSNRFVSIRNGGVDEVVREGNEWVLNARFNDAKFFYDEDRKHSLDDFLEKTKGIVFQDKLGTVHQRAFRLSELTARVAQVTGADEAETEFARTAGLYAKADLSSGLVSELPALQGLIGGEYARAEGLPDPLCWAIFSHYDLSKNPNIDCEGARTAVRLVIADQLDKLAGYLGLGYVPSGSSDPYGLRRAATLMIEAALRWPARFPGFAALAHMAQDCYTEQGVELSDFMEPLNELFRSRYEAILETARYDIVEAALRPDYAAHHEALDPQGVRFRIKALEVVQNDIAFIQTATRPQNIVSAAVGKGIAFTFHEPLQHLEGLDSETGSRLAGVVQQLAPSVAGAVLEERELELIAALKKLEQPINEFFDSTMVMAEDETTRSARLSLLHGVNLLLREAGDFSKIVISGE